MKVYPHTESEFFFCCIRVRVYFPMRSMLCHCGHVGHSCVQFPTDVNWFCCVIVTKWWPPMLQPLHIWLENKAVPFLLRSLWSRPPGCVNPLASAHSEGRKGWGHGCNQWEHLRFSDEPVLHYARGCLRAQLVSLARGQWNKRGTGTMVRKNATKVRVQGSTHGGGNWSHF